jgi:hypothetical protein
MRLLGGGDRWRIAQEAAVQRSVISLAIVVD